MTEPDDPADVDQQAEVGPVHDDSGQNVTILKPTRETRERLGRQQVRHQDVTHGASIPVDSIGSNRLPHPLQREE